MRQSVRNTEDCWQVERIFLLPLVSAAGRFGDFAIVLLPLGDAGVILESIDNMGADEDQHIPLLGQLLVLRKSSPQHRKSAKARDAGFLIRFGVAGHAA